MPGKIDHINHCSETEFIELLAGIYEHSRWVPELIVSSRPFSSPTALRQAMCAVVKTAPKVQRMNLLCSHPELAGREAGAGTLTDASQREQAAAGLDQCSAAELETIKSLNQAYRARFEFPFIIAVTGLDKFQIIAAMSQRLNHSRDEEFDTALAEVDKIAAIRLAAVIDD